MKLFIKISLVVSTFFGTSFLVYILGYRSGIKKAESAYNELHKLDIELHNLYIIKLQNYRNDFNRSLLIKEKEWELQKAIYEYIIDKYKNNKHK